MKKLICTLWAGLLLAVCLPALAEGGAAPDERRMDVKYICTGCSAMGSAVDADGLEEEAYLIFRAEGRCEFSIGGSAVNLPYRVRADGVYVVNWYGMELECVPTAGGFEMDFCGVTLHYAPRQAAAQQPAPNAPAREAAQTGDPQRLNVRYVSAGYTVMGRTRDDAALEGEQWVVFRADGSCEFSIGGPAVSLPYRVRADGVYVVNWYGVEFECVPTRAGFDMDFYGVTISFAPVR